MSNRPDFNTSITAHRFQPRRIQFRLFTGAILQNCAQAIKTHLKPNRFCDVGAVRARGTSIAALALVGCDAGVPRRRWTPIRP